DLANQLFSAPTRDALVERVRAEQAAMTGSSAADVATPAAPAVVSPARVPRVDVPLPPDLEPHVLRDAPLRHIFPYLNVQMLYGKQLGLRGLVTRLLAEGDPKARELHEVIETLKTDVVERRWIRAHAVYRWFRARAHGETIVLFEPDGGETAREHRAPE